MHCLATINLHNSEVVVCDFKYLVHKIYLQNFASRFRCTAVFDSYNQPPGTFAGNILVSGISRGQALLTEGHGGGVPL